jgi:long-chain acyl-CoA synthetase
MSLENLTIPAMLQESFVKFRNQKSLVFVDGEEKTYAQLEIDVRKAAIQLRSLGVQKGDRVGILSLNMPQWGIASLAINSVGAVVVPVLPDFHPNEIKNIFQHAGVSLVYVSETLRSKLEPADQFQIIRIEKFEVVADPEKYNIARMDHAHFRFEEIAESDLASIIYTSGTTGKSKGVMLTHKNIVWTAQQSRYFRDVVPDDRFLSVLPLSHTFENTLGLILPLMNGASVHYLQKPPAAPVLLPEINGKFITRNLYHIPVFRQLLHKVAGKKLLETFGGELKFFGVGGAKLDDRVERFLMEAGFPLAIGYGMTETSPLLAGAGVGKLKFLSTGTAMPGVQLRIEGADPKTGQGEIQVKGENVMRGYYLEPQMTKDAFTDDGWLKTGDLGYFDKKGRLFIKGRIKNMIVGSSGENIYPEEIESIINRMDFVLESLVIEQKGRLVAMVHLNMEELEQKYQNLKSGTVNFLNDKADEILREIQRKANEEMNKFSQIQRIVVQPVPFEKTPTQKIKRFLYNS